MQIEEIIQIIIIIVLGLYVVADAAIKIIKKLKGDDEVEWKAQLSFAADLIEKGVEIPKDMMIKLLRHKLTASEYAKFVSLETKKINKEK